MEKESNDLLMAIFTKGFLKMIGRVVMENTTGRTKAISRDIFPTVCEWDKVYGKRTLEILISTRVNTKMIRNGASEYLLGLMEMYIKEVIKEICEMAMEKCLGQMAAITMVVGKMGFSMEKVMNYFNVGELYVVG